MVPSPGVYVEREYWQIHRDLDCDLLMSGVITGYFIGRVPFLFSEKKFAIE